MMSRLTQIQWVSKVFWILAIVAILIWTMVPGYVVGWDLRVYGDAIKTLSAGHDPYADGSMIQRIFHADGPHPPGTPEPFTYIYPPLTLPLLRLIGKLPLGLSAAIYWVLFALAVLGTIRVGLALVEEGERPVFMLLAPVAVFFPGLLQNDTLFSGNVASVLYGAVLTAALVGWRRGDWRWFYGLTLLASCFKAPMLSLLAIPIFSARRQWIPAGATGAAGCLLFAVQPLIWPVLFRHYLEAVELRFSFNHDVGSSAAGLLADLLYNRVPYSVTSGVFYLFYGSLVVAALWVLSRLYLNGCFSLQQWAPVLLLGTLLLNPRIIEYDIAPMTIPMALIAWRFFANGRKVGPTVVLSVVFFTVINVLAARWNWKALACLEMFGLFVAGCCDLWRFPRSEPSIEELREIGLETTACIQLER